VPFHDPKARAALLQMAQVWLRLAGQKKRLLHPQEESQGDA
jgi:hypothetical protein